jgi:glycosyltransferase involved in cell wall biosynthesis
MSLRVVMVGACPYPAPQGSQVLLTETAVGLRAAGHDVLLVVYGHGEGEPPPGLPLARARRVPGHRRTAAGPSPLKPVADLFLAAAVRRACREHRAQIVHAHNYEGLFAALASGFRPVVYHAHNCMEDELPHFAPTGLRGTTAAFGHMLDRALPRRADAVVAPHEALARHLVERCGCEPARVRVVAPPCDATRFTPAPVTGGLPPLLYTGNLDAYQNLGMLREAHGQLLGRYPGLLLIVATHAGGAVTWAETRRLRSAEDLAALLAEESVFVCPRVSWSGYPMKLLNAMAAAKPVVACRGAAPPVAHGETGLLADGRSPSSFAEAVSRLLDDPALRARLGQSARSVLLGNHQPEHIAGAIARVYEECLARRTTAPANQG